MRLDPTVAGLVLFAALLHACWNAVVKADSDRLVSLSLVMAVGGVMGGIAALFLPLPVAAAWPYLIGSVLIHNVYYACLLSAYRHGDLSHVYPIARGLGPLLVALLSGRLIGEALTLVEGGGVLVLSVGIVGLAFSRGWPRHLEGRATLYAIATGFTIAGYTICDGMGARASGNALGYIAWLNILEGPGLLAVALWQRGARLLPYLRQHWWRGAAGGVIATVGYGIAIWALSQGAMAHVAAVRETSVLFAAVIGTVLLKEGFGGRRILAAAMVVAGLLLMNLPIGRG